MYKNYLNVWECMYVLECVGICVLECMKIECNVMYRNIPGCIGMYKNLLEYNGILKKIKNILECIGRYWNCLDLILCKICKF